MEITELFTQLLQSEGSVDMAELEFKKRINEDSDLRRDYRQWCHEYGSSEKNGFRDYCDEILENENEVWETLSEYTDDDQ